MPYDSIEAAKKAGFPTNAEDIPMTLAQINHLAEIYDAIKKAGTADDPFAVAWDTWKGVYKKEGNKWVEIKKKEELKQLAIITNAEFTSKESHDAILQTLERWIPGYAEGKGNEGAIFYSREPFEHSIANWNGIDLIYAQEHPNMVLYAKDPAQALKKINGKIVGKLSNARIEVAGHPRQMGQIEINDGEAQALYEEGKLSLSTGFFCPLNKNYELVGELIPNHILLFQEDENNLPKDRGAVILNKEEMGEMANIGKVISAKNESEFKALIDKLWLFFRNLTTGDKKEEVKNQKRKKLEERKMDEKKEAELTSKLETVTTELANKTSEFETATKAHEDEVKGYKEKIAAFENKKKEAEKAKLDTNWETLKKTVIPVGLIHKEEDEKKLRAEYEQNPHEFLMKAVGFEKRSPTGEEGNEFGTDPDEIAKAAKEIETEAAMEVPV